MSHHAKEVRATSRLSSSSGHRVRKASESSTHEDWVVVYSKVEEGGVGGSVICNFFMCSLRLHVRCVDV